MRDHGLMLLTSGLLRARDESGLRTLRLRANQSELNDAECIAAVTAARLPIDCCEMTA